MKKSNEHISVEEAAKMLGISPQAVRIAMRRNLFKPPIGFVICEANNYNNYHIFRNKVLRFLDAKQQ